MRDEGQRLVEGRPVDVAVRLGGGDLGVEVLRRERPGAGHAENVLAHRVERAGAGDGGVLRADGGGVDGGTTLQHLEAVRGHEQRAARLVEPVVGAADALHQAARAFRCADVDDEVDVPPVYAEVERRGADHRFQLAGRHRLLDAAALAGVERAVVERDGEVVLVHRPQRLEDEFGLRARVDEDERHAGGADGGVDLVQRVARRVAGPRHALLGIEDGEVGRRAGRREDEAGEMERALPSPACGRRWPDEVGSDEGCRRLHRRLG